MRMMLEASKHGLEAWKHHISLDTKGLFNQDAHSAALCIYTHHAG